MASSSKTHERVRSLYISSENVDYFESSQRVTINLRDSVTPQDDYELCYSLKAIGFNSTAMNISHLQKNNVLLIEVEYDYSDVIYDKVLKEAIGMPIDPPEASLYTYVPHNPANEHIKQHTYIIPDAHYTLDELLEELSTPEFILTGVTLTADQLSFHEPIPSYMKQVLPSGMFRNDELDKHDIRNILPIIFKWTPTSSGYIIEYIPILGLQPDNLKDSYDGGTMGNIHQTEYTPSIKKIRILPHPTSSKLFDLLFTNYNTDFPHTPISVANHRTAIRGLNPHKGIEFDLSESLKITELGNEAIYDVPNGKYPNEEKVNYMNYIAYYKPVLDPVYVDVEISLPNIAMDEEGQKNILARIYTLGAKDGNSSLFQAWENPKINVISGSSGFSSITLEFTSQENKWEFFNLEFTIELEIFEVLEDQNINPHIQDVNIPESDPISSVASTIPQHEPFSSNYFPYRVTSVQPVKKGRYL